VGSDRSERSEKALTDQRDRDTRHARKLLHNDGLKGPQVSSSEVKKRIGQNDRTDRTRAFLRKYRNNVEAKFALSASGDVGNPDTILILPSAPRSRNVQEKLQAGFQV
jgi:hypothetical protein